MVNEVVVVDPNQPIPVPTRPEDTWAKATGSRDVDFNTRDKYFLSALYPVYSTDNEETLSATIHSILLKDVVSDGESVEEDTLSATLDRLVLRSIVLEEEAPVEEDTVSGTLDSIMLRSIVKEVDFPTEETSLSATLTTLNFRQDVVVDTSPAPEEDSLTATLTSIQLV